MTEWECGKCGYIHEGENPPRRCPECGAASDKFKAFEEEWADEESDEEEEF